ncbi:MAG: ExeM/NucH family extracellular endonuclease, partial [Gemmatimonadetes bacterium]|nr:ExeM/NucH family extracellular endonuclease [Gemmatimonadota bacterium]
DDGSYEQNPATIVFARGRAPLGADNTLRGGDHVTGITGVLTQTTASGADGGSAYRLRPVNALNGGVPDFVAASPRDARPPDVGGTLRVASFNVLNYFNTFDGCTLGTGGAATSCRGADDAVEFDRQWRKIVAAVIAMDTDILGIIEIENDGYHARSAIADLVSRLNSATAAGRYMFINSDSATGDANVLGTDAIKVGLIYRRDRVSPAGRTAVLNSSMFVNGGESQPRNRPSLAQAFVQPDGGSVIVSVHHFKSKGSACDAPDAGDGQGNCNTARTVAARELLTWLDTDPTGTGDPNVLIIGDLNAYAREDPVAVLVRGGYTDLLAGRAAESPAEPASSDVPIGERSGTAGYSFVFNGQWGYLDHALASTALLPQVTGAVAWHINADEPNVLDYNTNFKTAAQLSTLYDDGPFRSSDHDPVIVGLRLATRGDTR